MNVLTETADGLMALTAREAQQRIDQLTRWRDDTSDADEQAALQVQINALERVTRPETAYEAWGLA